MVDVAVKVLAFIAGLVAGVMSYPYLNQYVFAVLAFLGALAVFAIVGYVVYRLLARLIAELS